MRLKPTDNRRGCGLLAAVTTLLIAALPTLAVEPGAGPVQPVESIEAAAHSYVESLLPPGAAETRITVLPLDGRLRLAECGSPLAAQLPPETSLTARATVRVSCAGPSHWAVYLPVIIESRISVLVLRHAVARDARLLPEDVTVETRSSAGVATAYLDSVAELTGRTVRRPLAIGTALSVEMFTADTVIHQGQQVTLLAGGPDMEIRAVGRALMDAPAGARIEVQNLSSMTIVEGVVESADVVRVAL
jgi:flagellar basal body P-ring formation protein FlgA